MEKTNSLINEPNSKFLSNPKSQESSDFWQKWKKVEQAFSHTA
jgi:hypothetical protein